jgi:lipopolysaccharide/colanic/teichoic acid biosynthesis glycosyltransferase
MLYKKVKRVIDLALSITALLFLLPILLLVALLVRLTMGGPVLFCQLRPGLSGKLFEMYKFRTMLDAPEGVVVSDEARITKLGRILRSTSLDELPELLNVIKGDMSLVGPRPLLGEYLAHYSESQKRRHDTLPGITGLAQVRGRNNLTWKNKFRYDIFYVEHNSIALDIQIIFETISVVFFRKGFRSHGELKKFEKDNLL